MSNEIDENEILWVQNSESWQSLGVQSERVLTVDGTTLRLELEEIVTTVGRGADLSITTINLSPDDALALSEFLKTAAGNALYLEATK